ncbi:hypothetical protein CE91St62_39680 [Lachnospiraceae bacterium]|uniref:DUF7768 domain-containing protein n=1 Tax=Extibacter sp. GGCC_0201 TaxID=2731209 RepID=UPI001AA1CB62|nr:hypothetical protein [Extibacter sp. GGCC_0201]MBO1720671.1 hypothetical protein [Extibacter sp. GGCC_0201]BDF35907.1 hypothetical protein CE91St61_39820 [Lachnospiraceae bacterium]BDF39907.1 hypothetical protein CE91St62_39680 [Lachnospiraceae bacterium]
MKKKAYICSPLSAPTKQEMIENMLMARQYMQKIREKFGYRTYAPHAYLPELLDDHLPEERAVALSFGLEVLRLCDALIICGKRISSGMNEELYQVLLLKMEVYWYDEEDTGKLIRIRDRRQVHEMPVQR